VHADEVEGVPRAHGCRRPSAALEIAAPQRRIGSLRSRWSREQKRRCDQKGFHH
jgi:hypothetical protein